MPSETGAHDWGDWSPLQTPRLTLRRLSPEDATAVSEWLSDGRVTATMMWELPVPYPVETALEWIRGTETQMGQGSVATWAITLSTNSARMIGAITLHPNWPMQRAGLGYWLGAAHWGQGFMSEAASRVIRFAFEDLRLHRVHADCFASNRASWRVLEKAGMTREGRLEEHRLKQGRFEDELVYGIVNPTSTTREVPSS